MARLFLIALMIWALAFAGTDCGSAKAPIPQAREAKTEESPAPVAVVLTEKQPAGSWTVSAELLAGDTEILEVPITKVVNPGMTSVSVFVYLSNTEKGNGAGGRELVGTFNLYPPDRPGKFLLSAGPALRKVSAASKTSKPENLQLIFEMKRVDETRTWTPIELSVGQPRWRAAQK